MAAAEAVGGVADVAMAAENEAQTETKRTTPMNGQQPTDALRDNKSNATLAPTGDEFWRNSEGGRATTAFTGEHVRDTTESNLAPTSQLKGPWGDVGPTEGVSGPGR